MLSAYLIRAIENHAEDLTREVLNDVQANPRLPAFHRISGDELHRRVYDLFHNLGRWLGEQSDATVEAVYAPLGRMRHAEGIPLSEVVFALSLVKDHLRSYVRRTDAASTAVELYQEEELDLMASHFFDKAVYYIVRGYEAAQAQSSAVRRAV